MKLTKFLPAAILMVALAIGFTTSPSPAMSKEKHGITVEQAWSRARPGNAMIGGAFMMIENEGSKADRLVGVSSPVAKRAEIHESVMKNGVMSMTPVTDLEILPGQTVMLKPGGYHVMLMGLTGTLEEGTMFPLTLEFEHAGPIEVKVHVKASGAMSGGHTH